ncbi:uncharacterized protein LOC125240512 [Leguminivora glycinivorella]|uniref:uncharacterized protein LOC125240512 n=1 Tax=Leguminivora glycinivorella TaxID=1035111 RepID=UPI00200D425C|nr:uncharacterized protein LOC125240512 [Leguminivora glycinivorella]
MESTEEALHFCQIQFRFSRQPIQISADGLGLRKNVNSENVASQLHKKTLKTETTNGAVSLLTPVQFKECVQLPSYSVLTPASNTSKLLTETGFDKSVEPPPYSPLSPAPNNSKNIHT